MKLIKKIVLVGHNNSGSNKIATAIIEKFPEVNFMIVETTGIYYNKSFAKSIIKLVKESSIRFCAWRFYELLKFKLKGESLKKLARANNCKYISTCDINSSLTLKTISDFQPDILSSLYTMHIYKGEVLSVAKYGSITAHPSKIPAYRGLEVFFWQLANNETESAVSIFEITPRIDEGKIYWCKSCLIDKDETVESLYEKITNLACNGLTSVIKSIDNGENVSYISKEKSSYFPMPTRGAVRKFLADKKRFF